MKRKIILFLILMLLISATLIAGVNENYRKKIKKEGLLVKVVNIITPVEYEVENKETKFKIRLLNTYAPDEKSIYYVESLKKVKKLIYGKNVYLMYDKEKYDENQTHLVLLYYSDAKYLLNATMIDRGYAYYESTYPCWLDSELMKLQNKAKKSQNGIWKEYSGTNTSNSEEIPYIETIEIDDIGDIKDVINDPDLEKTIGSFLKEESENSYLEDNITEIDLSKIPDSYIEDILTNKDNIYDNIDEIINDNSFLDIYELLYEKEKKEYISDKKYDINEDWVSIAFSIKISDISDTKYLKEKSLNLYKLLEEELSKIPLEINLLSNSNKLLGVTSNLEKASDTLIYLFGNFSDLSIKPNVDFEGKKYYSLNNLSIFAQSSKLVLIGTNLGIKYYIHNLSDKYSDEESTFYNMLDNFSIYKAIKNFNLEKEDNWLFINSLENVKNNVFPITKPTIEGIEGISFVYKPINNKHKIDIMFFYTDSKASDELTKFLTGLIDIAKILGNQSKTFLTILDNIKIKKEDTSIILSINFSNEDIQKINSELND